MKKFLGIPLIISVVLSLFIILQVNAETEFTEGVYIYSVKNNTANIIECDYLSVSGDVIIPSKLGGYPVTAIGEYAFNGCDKLTSITIPDSVLTIDEYAFHNCDGLIEFKVEKNNPSYCSVDGNLFNKNKTTLLQYAIGKTNTNYVIPYGVTKICDEAFYLCNSLKEVTIPESVVSIGNDAFSFCENLSDIVIPNSVESIGDYAFSFCEKLRKITIPDSVVNIGYGVFGGCDELIAITVSKNNPNYCSVDGSLFDKNKTTLIQYVNGNKDFEYVIPDGVKVIGSYAFWSCRLSNIILPEGVIRIEESAFTNCDNLINIDIPNGVTNIGDYAFSLSDGLCSITIPGSVSSIGKFAFYKCVGLKDIYYGSNQSKWNGILMEPNDLSDIKIHYNITVFYEIKNDNYEILNGRLKINAIVKNNIGKRKCIVVAAVYDQQGGFKKATLSPVELPASASTSVLLNVENHVYNNGDKVKLFLWSNTNRLIPLVDSLTIEIKK